MENRIHSIKFDLGSLPVKDPDKFEMIDMPDNIFPNQFLYTKKAHHRTLDILLGKAISGNISEDIFILDYSFPYYLPEIEDGQINDNMMSITRSKSYNPGSNITIPPLELLNGKKIIYGKLPRYNKTKKTENLILDHPKQYYEFYSMDKDMDVHKTEINVKYLPSKDIMKFTVVCDDKTKVILDTKGNYMLKSLKAPYRERVKKSGNLLYEKDYTLFIDNIIPVKVYLEISKN